MEEAEETVIKEKQNSLRDHSYCVSAWPTAGDKTCRDLNQSEPTNLILAVKEENDVENEFGESGSYKVVVLEEGCEIKEEEASIKSDTEDTDIILLSDLAHSPDTGRSDSQYSTSPSNDDSKRMNEQMETTHIKEDMEPVKVEPVVTIKEESEEKSINRTISSSVWEIGALRDHSYCAWNGLFITTSQNIQNILNKVKENILSSSSPSPLFNQSKNEEMKQEEGSDMNNNDDDGISIEDSEYHPDEDLSSDSQYTTIPSNDYSKTDSLTFHLTTKIRKGVGSDGKMSSTKMSVNHQPCTSSEIHTDSQMCCSGKFANMEEHMDDCKGKPTFSCCLCNAVCGSEDALLKHTIENHPTAMYICGYCLKVFQTQDGFRSHACCYKPKGNVHISSGAPAAQLSVLTSSDCLVPMKQQLNNSSNQVPPSTPILGTNTVKLIQKTPTVNNPGQGSLLAGLPYHPLSPVPTVVTMQSTKAINNSQPISHEVLPVKPVAVTPVAALQTLVRNLCPPASARPNAPSSLSSSITRPSLSNQAKMSIVIPTRSYRLIRPSNVFVSSSPTVNSPSPAVVSANSIKSIPAPKQTLAANFVRHPQLTGNTSVVTSLSHPTRLGGVRNNLPQVPLHMSPTQTQAPTSESLKIVSMFVNKSKELTLQKRLKESWRSKTIFPCRHCGAISRQPSLRVRHRYLHQGLRLYRCQCGRSFQRRLHLLRHQVQHAESVRFVCSWCGNTFEGAHKLTWHKQRLHRKCKTLKGRRNVKKACTAAFDCVCGQAFARPSALLWHILKNSNPMKRIKKSPQWI